jgi:LemA protein
VDTFGLHLHSAPMRKQRFKRSAHSAHTHYAPAPWKNAGDIVFVGPAGHEFDNIPGQQGFVKRGFDVIRGTANGGMELGFLAWHVGIVLQDRPRSSARGFKRVYSTGCFHGGSMANSIVRVALASVLAGLVSMLAGCGYNDFQRLDEQTKSAWSEVLNQYQRRTDLVPNIVATVKGEAAFEQDTLTKVIEARAKATSIQVTPETLNNPEAFAKFQAAQGELGSTLSRLMVVSEQYPNLKANQGFSDLRVQLEGTENRITVARNRYIQAVQEYNVLARSFPNNLTAMVFSYTTKPNFTVANEAAISTPPTVDFNKK